MSPEDRKDYLADGRSAARREAFRRAGESAKPSFLAYLRFCDDLARLFGADRPEVEQNPGGRRLRL